MDFNNLSEELKQKALACKSPEEVFALAKKEGIELSEQQLDAIAGGSWVRDTCPNDTTPVVTPQELCPFYM